MTNEQIKVVNKVFVDLEVCEQENAALNKIIIAQDTMLKSKIALQELYQKQSDYNEDLKYQLTAALNTQVQKFNMIEAAYKAQSKAQKKRVLLTGSLLGIGLSVCLAVAVIRLVK